MSVTLWEMPVARVLSWCPGRVFTERDQIGTVWLVPVVNYTTSNIQESYNQWKNLYNHLRVVFLISDLEVYSKLVGIIPMVWSSVAIFVREDNILLEGESGEVQVIEGESGEVQVVGALLRGRPVWVVGGVSAWVDGRCGVVADRAPTPAELKTTLEGIRAQGSVPEKIRQIVLTRLVLFRLNFVDSVQDEFDRLDIDVDFLLRLWSQKHQELNHLFCRDLTISTGRVHAEIMG